MPNPQSDENVRKAQKEDADTKPLIDLKEPLSRKPEWPSVSTISPATKQYWTLWNSLHIKVVNRIVNESPMMKEAQTGRFYFEDQEYRKNCIVVVPEVTLEH